MAQFNIADAKARFSELVDRALAGYAVMAVTNEPGPDGSQAPTQQPQLFGSIA